MDLDVNYIINNIQKILNKTHNHDAKKIINTRKHDRITFACPICGDSHKDPYKKRGHLFFNNLYYKCYNEDCRSNFTKLCKTYNVNIDNNKKMEFIKYIDMNFHKYAKRNDDWILDNVNLKIPLDKLQEWFDNGEGPAHSFKPVQFGSAVYMYLKERQIPDDIIKSKFYEGIKTFGKYNEPTIIFLNTMGDNIIGMQERNLKKGKYRKFKIWTFKEIYEAIYKTEMDDIEAISYNKISYLFNLFNVNYEQPVNIFEGYIDSLFMPNSIGAVGINTDYSILQNDDIDLRFFFDNDNIGKRKALKYLKEGYTVFLWEKLIEDLSKNYADKHKYKIWFNKNITDLNKLMLLEDIHYSKLIKYFSVNKFDIRYININKEYKKEKNPNIHINIGSIINDLKYGKLNKNNKT